MCSLFSILSWEVAPLQQLYSGRVEILKVFNILEDFFVVIMNISIMNVYWRKPEVILKFVGAISGYPGALVSKYKVMHVSL